MYWQKGYPLNDGKYIIESFLGRGAFGLTYKAVQNNLLKLPVVVKIPDPTLQTDKAYPRYVKKFIQEVEILGRLCREPHPNIVSIIDYIEEGENKTPCLVMEYIAGQDLFKLIEPQDNEVQPLPEHQAVNYICQIGDALTELHNNSIVHRDIHPGNIMLSKGRHPILIDFGLAGEIEPASSFSKGFGNKDFAPYEQFKGSKEPTVDIYGLAATLYYAVTGTTPATSWDRRYNQADLIEPKQYNPNVSNQLNQAIIEGMKLEANERPQSIQIWLNLLVNHSEADDLSSDVGVDYRKLRDLLAAGNWKDADDETLLIMLQAVGREEGNWIREEELLNFPCTDLRTIDRLWVKYSNGRFGFSVQKQIYLSIGGKADGKYDQEAWEQFGDRIGWRVNANWLNYSEVNFYTFAPKGHLPVFVFWCHGIVDIMRFSSLASKLAKCNI
ncbi:serine/threonine kinase [Cylindrospermum sp. NIES-4074]|nr:serine/threonine kinase [Cylindrospermum sp. NIES-4074]